MAQVRDWGDDGAEIEACIVKEVFRNAAGRVGWIDDIAWLVTLLASVLAGVINGATLISSAANREPHHH